MSIGALQTNRQTDRHVDMWRGGQTEEGVSERSCILEYNIYIFTYINIGSKADLHGGVGGSFPSLPPTPAYGPVVIGCIAGKLLEDFPSYSTGRTWKQVLNSRRSLVNLA